MHNAIKTKAGLAALACVAAANLAFTQPAMAQNTFENPRNSGDLGIVPYYNVNDGFVTGVHIVNTSDQTQVVKFRLRRAEDSEEVLDFNIVMSAYDVWTGTIRLNGEQIAVRTFDATCTVPDDNETFITSLLPGSADQREGYVEIIGMGQADSTQPISQDADHGNNGVPSNCESVESNFLAANVINNGATNNAGGATSFYSKGGFPLMVSYFLRNVGTGIEFGNNATMIANFTDFPMMTNQQFSMDSGDLNGSTFPDLDGGGRTNGGQPAGVGNRYGRLRTELRSASVANEWSFNAGLGVATDWVLTLPGQYLLAVDPTAGFVKDIPAIITPAIFDREEGGLAPIPSPAPNFSLPYEVNVFHWGPDQSVFETGVGDRVDPGIFGIDATSGWAEFEIENTTDQAVIDFTGGDPVLLPAGTTRAAPPVLGNTFWQRSLGTPTENFGRVIQHVNRRNLPNTGA